MDLQQCFSAGELSSCVEATIEISESIISTKGKSYKLKNPKFKEIKTEFLTNFGSSAEGDKKVLEYVQNNYEDIRKKLFGTNRDVAGLLAFVYSEIGIENIKALSVSIPTEGDLIFNFYKFFSKEYTLEGISELSDDLSCPAKLQDVIKACWWGLHIALSKKPLYSGIGKSEFGFKKLVVDFGGASIIIITIIIILVFAFIIVILIKRNGGTQRKGTQSSASTNDTEQDTKHGDFNRVQDQSETQVDSDNMAKTMYSLVYPLVSTTLGGLASVLMHYTSKRNKTKSDTTEKIKSEDKTYASHVYFNQKINKVDIKSKCDSNSRSAKNT